MINTVIYKKENLICCHSVGIADCIKIKDVEIEKNTFSYEAYYSNKSPERVKNVIIATDVKLV